MFKEGDRVISKTYGLGTIEKVYSEKAFSRNVIVKFDKYTTRNSFTKDGYYDIGLCPSGSGRDYSNDRRNIKKVENV